MVIGAMTASMVSLTLSGSFTISGNEFIIQDYIDQIFPMLLPLLYTLFIFLFNCKLGSGKQQRYFYSQL